MNIMHEAIFFYDDLHEIQDIPSKDKTNQL